MAPPSTEPAPSSSTPSQPPNPSDSKPKSSQDRGDAEPDDDAASTSSTTTSSSLSALLDIDDPALIALQGGQPSNTPATITSTSDPSSRGGGALLSSTLSPFSGLHTYTSEKAAMHAIADSPRAVLLFTHASFPLCGVMASHLERIAAGTAAASAASAVSAGASAGENKWEQENVLFISLEAAQAPFLTERLKIRVLPAVVGYVGGEEAGRLTGFEGLGKRARRGDGGGAGAGKGWVSVAKVLRGWGVLGRELLVGEDEDESEEEEDGDESEGDGGGDRGDWIGGKRGINGTMTRLGVGNGNKARGGAGAGGGGDDDDDDWD